MRAEYPTVRAEPPMPSGHAVRAAVRGAEMLVARVEFTDVAGDARVMDFDQSMAFALAMDLLSFCHQLSKTSFTCPRCHRTSHHPEDVKNGYCGNCHDFTGVPNA